MSKKHSLRARTPAEKFRDDVLAAYTDWVEWSRTLRRVFVSLPSYGVGDDSVQSMCEDFGWKYATVSKQIENSKSFKAALGEFVANGHKYRTHVYKNASGTALKYEVKWSALQQVYMLESSITSFIKAETGKISTAENKLIERSGLLEIEPMAHISSQSADNNGGTTMIDISGESSLFALEESFSTNGYDI